MAVLDKAVGESRTRFLSITSLTLEPLEATEPHTRLTCACKTEFLKSCDRLA